MLLSSQVTVTKLFHFTGHTSSIFAIDAGRNENTVITGAGDGLIVEWNMHAEDDDATAHVALARVQGNIYSLLHNRAEEIVYAGDMYGIIHLIDLKTNKEKARFDCGGTSVYDIKPLDEKTIIAGSGNGKCYLLNASNGSLIREMNIADKSIRCITVIPGTNMIVFSCSDHMMYVYDFTEWTLIRRLAGHLNSVFCASVTTDGKYLVSGSRDAQLIVRDIENNFANIHRIPAHLYTVNDIKMQPSGDLFATAGRDKHIKIWDAAHFHLLKVIDAEKFGGHINSVNKLFWSGWNNCLISCGDDRSVIGWKITVDK